MILASWKQKEGVISSKERSGSPFIKMSQKDTFELNSPMQLPPFASRDSDNESDDLTERTPNFANTASFKRIAQLNSMVKINLLILHRGALKILSNY